MRHIPTIMMCTIVLTISGCSSPSPPDIERNSAGDIIAYPELEDRALYDWEAYEIVDKRHVRIRFAGGPEETCVREDSRVEEDDNTITIFLYVGKIRNADKLCKENQIVELPYVTDTMLVKTELPIGDRTIKIGGSDEVPHKMSKMHD